MSWNLLADIGGTNARFATERSGVIEHQHTVSTNQETGVIGAASEFVANIGNAPHRAVFAAAGVVRDGAVALTNSSQHLTEAQIGSLTTSGEATIINDFEAAAWSLATVEMADVSVIQSQHAALPTGNRIIVGPGTGLGVGALVWGQSGPVVVPGEGGHIGVSPQSYADIAVFEALIEEWPETRMGEQLRFEAEAICSGTGLPRLHRAVCTALGTKPEDLTGAEILRAAASKRSELAARTAELFSTHLAQVCGDLALTFSAVGGIFITGGVSLANGWLFDEKFRAALNAGGRYTKMRSNFPVYLYTQTQFGLIGCRNALASWSK